MNTCTQIPIVALFVVAQTGKKVSTNSGTGEPIAVYLYLGVLLNRENMPVLLLSEHIHASYVYSNKRDDHQNNYAEEKNPDPQP